MKSERKKSNLLVRVMKTHFVLLLVSCSVVLPISAYGDTPNISWVGPGQTSYRYSGGIMVGFVSTADFINEGGPGTIEISARIEKDGSEHSTFETKYFPVQAGRDYELFIEGDFLGDWLSQIPPFAIFGLIIDSSPPAYTLQLPLPSASLNSSASASITNIELRQYLLLLSTEELTIAEGGTATFSVSLRLDPLGTFEVAVANESGDSDITVESGASLVFDSSNYSVPQSVTLRAAEDGDRFNGTALIAVTAPGVTTSRVTVTERDNEPYANTVLVDADAPGANDGSSWADAFTDLQAALSFAAGFTQFEVWVAQGVYRPAAPSGARTASFQLLNGVAIRGGYAGFGEPDPDDRDIDKYRTILSGDLNDNDIQVSDPSDLLDEPTRGENSYTIVTGSGTTAILDGFVLTGGNANGSFPYWYGGGMYNYNRSPTVTNCTFSENSAKLGGGIYNYYYSSPTLTNCTFSGNSASEDGGGMYNYKSEPTLTNCTFNGNSAEDYGGGMHNEYSKSPTVINCTFSENSARRAGGISNYYSSPMVTNCTFSGNSADLGGGMYNNSSEPTLINCTFSGNSADFGGGMYNSSSDPTLTNCTFTGNSAEDYGGGMRNWGSAPTITNCIIYQDTAGISGDEISNTDSTPTISYSDIQGCGASGAGWDTSLGTDGGQNLDVNPLFRDADGSDDTVGTADDNLRLLAGSLCIDAGDNTAVPSDANDLDGDGDTTEPIPWDLDRKPRIIGDEVDMGAYEFQGNGIVGDFCGANSDQPDGYVDYWDLLYFAQRWHSSPSDNNWEPRCDLDKEDNYVDYWDLLVFAQQWHKGVKP